MDVFVILGLFVIFCVVLIFPFSIRKIEENLEIFLFFCGVIALTLAGFANLPGEQTGWSMPVVIEALTSPLNIVSVAGIPIGIVQIVLVMGFFIYYFHHHLERAINNIVEVCSIALIVPLLILIIGLVSSIISAILAALILVEIINALPLVRESKIEITVIACFSIGIGAGLTPLGEPLTTIVVSRLSGDPYHAGFGFLAGMLGIYIIIAVIILGILSLVVLKRRLIDETNMRCVVEREKVRDIIIRAGKVYLFIMALIFLGEGFQPLILGYVVLIPPEALYWVNMISAVLDNATLAAAEISPVLSLNQITSALLALLISGGMLIPGNIPNIIAATKTGITSREWARLGVPLGIGLMAIFFCLLFIPPLLGLA
jgi:predicted cation transporter